MISKTKLMKIIDKTKLELTILSLTTFYFLIYFFVKLEMTVFLPIYSMLLSFFVYKVGFSKKKIKYLKKNTTKKIMDKINETNKKKRLFASEIFVNYVKLPFEATEEEINKAIEKDLSKLK